MDNAATTLPAPPSTGWLVNDFLPTGPTSGWVWLTAIVQGPTHNPSSIPEEELDLTVDSGRSWADHLPSLLATATSSRDIVQLGAVGTDGVWLTYGAGYDVPETLMVTTDRGLHWATLGRLPSSHCSLGFLSETIGWCTVTVGYFAEQSIEVYRTTDGGRHWLPALRTPTYTGSFPHQPCGSTVTFTSPRVAWSGFACQFTASPLYESTDAGRTWERRPAGPLPAGWQPAGGPGEWLSGPVLSGAVGAFAAEDFSNVLVYHTTDGGATWEAVVPPGSPRWWAVDLVTATTWKLTSERTVLTTTDAGRSWRVATSHLYLPYQDEPQYVDAEDGWYIAAGAELDHTTNGGRTWEPVRLPPAPGGL
jgi:photosystem II stability/assembly factor-like uncharacterized protein